MIQKQIKTFSNYKYVKDPLGSAKNFHSKVTRTIYPKGSFILKEGDKVELLYYIVDGVIEVGMNKKGKNRISDFFFENDFFTSFIGIKKNQPASSYYVAVTDCVIDSVNYEDIIQKADSSIVLNTLLRDLAENTLLQQLLKEKNLSYFKADERYSALIKYNSKIPQRITVKKIANYLGIHPQSLSRIRKNFQQVA